MRIVQDTCVWVSALRRPDASSAQVVDRGLSGADTPLMGAALLAEYEAQTARSDLWKGIPVTLAERRHHWVTQAVTERQAEARFHQLAAKGNPARGRKLLAEIQRRLTRAKN